MGRQHLRHQSAQGGDLCGHAVQTLVDQAGQLQAFTLAAGLELGERLVEQRHGLGIERLRVAGVGHQHAGPGQDFERVQRCGLLDQTGDGLGGGDQLRGALTVDLKGLAGVVFAQAQGAFDLAARKALAQAFAHRAFQIAQGLGQAQVRLR